MMSIHDVKVTVKTKPIELDDSSELMTQLTYFLTEKVQSMVEGYKMSTNQVSSIELSTWNEVLALEYKVPLEVKTIFLSPNYLSYQDEIVFGVIITQEILDAYHSVHQSELVSLIDEVFK